MNITEILTEEITQIRASIARLEKQETGVKASLKIKREELYKKEHALGQLTGTAENSHVATPAFTPYVKPNWIAPQS